jgi:hypothetical protein
LSIKLTKPESITVVGASFRSATTFPERQVIRVRKLRMSIFAVALVVAALCSTAVASAATAAPNPAPACTTHLGIPFTTSSEWFSDQSPGVIQDAIPMLFKPAGYRPSDNVKLSTWVKQHIVIAPAAASFVTIDKGCRDGHIENAYFDVTYPAGTKALVVLPSQYTTSMVSLTKTKKYTKLVAKLMWGIALDSCGNPIPGSHILIKIYVQVVVHKPKPKPKPKKHKTVQVKTTKPLQTCAGEIVTINGQTVCQTQSNTNTTTQSGTTQGQGSPVINNNNTIQVNVQQNQGQGQGQQQQLCSQGQNCNTTPPPTSCTSNCNTTPPPALAASLTLPTINMVNANNSSGCKPIQVQASSTGDSLMVNPQDAAVAQCDANGNVGSQADSLMVPIPQGNSTVYVDFFEGNDSDQPSQDSAAVTVTNQGTTLTSGTISWDIKYPTRPS